MRHVLILLASLVFAPALSAATVALLDGRAQSGDELRLSPDGAGVLLDGQLIALADCDWLQVPAAAAPAATGTGMALVLADGGWVPLSGVNVGPGQRLHFRTSLGELALAPGQFSAWGSQEWLDRTRSLDKDTVQLESGIYSGTVTDIRDGVLRIDIADLGPNELPVEQIQALRLAVPHRELRTLSLGLELFEGRPLVHLQPGIPLRLAVGGHEFAELPSQRLSVLGGRRVWLGELTPAEVLEEGAFGVVWRHSIDSGLDGGPLRLGGQRYRRGLTVHSKARLSWDLAGGFTRLRTRCGIADEVKDVGSCSVAFVADGREIWRHDALSGAIAPIDLDLDLTGVRRLALVVDYGARYDIGDHVVLADAWLLRAAKKRN